MSEGRGGGTEAEGEGTFTGWRIAIGPDSMADVLSEPFVASVLGALTGIGVLGLLMASARFVKPGDAFGGIVAGMVAVITGMLASLGLLLLYRWLAPDGFIWFGPSLVGAFVVVLGGWSVWLLKRMNDPNDGGSG